MRITHPPSSHRTADLRACMQADALDLDANVQETLERSAGADAQLSDIKALLGRMMFTGKSVHKKVSLSALT